MKSRISLTLFLVVVFSGAMFAQTADQYFAAGNGHYKQKNYTLAIASYTSALRLMPSSYATWFNRCQC